MKRRQLTIFLDEKESTSIESIRQKFNPDQFRLIKSHITLCREDEIEDLERIQHNLKNIEMDRFLLRTNGLVRFSEEKGVLIALSDEKGKFRELRKLVLNNEDSLLREHKAHITLMHPRNSTCDDDIFKELKKIKLPKHLTIKRISLIEQELGKKWSTLKEYNLRVKNKS